MLRSCIGCLILYCVSVIVIASPDKQDKVVVIGLAEGVDYVLPYEQVISSAWLELGYQVRYERLPADRSLLLSDSGMLDGELVRSRIIESNNKNLVRVPLLISKGELTLFCRKIVPCNRSVLNDRKTLVGVRAGSLTAIEFLRQHSAQALLLSSPDMQDMLNSDSRLDYVLTVAVRGYGNLDEISDPENLTSISLIAFDAWHYVHKKHAPLVPMLAESLARAKNKWLASYKQSALPD